jgi:hypothetical protein
VLIFNTAHFCFYKEFPPMHPLHFSLNLANLVIWILFSVPSAYCKSIWTWTEPWIEYFLVCYVALLWNILVFFLYRHIWINELGWLIQYSDELQVGWLGFYSQQGQETVQTGSGAHPASYPKDTRGSFPGSKAAGITVPLYIVDSISPRFGRQIL